MRRRARVAVATFAVLAPLGAIAAVPAGASDAHRATSAFPAPGSAVATARSTSKGSWVALPMGRLSQPLNTFWQLFGEPKGSASWTNQAEALAIATNGGIELASDGPTLLVAVRPANLLEYSAVLLHPSNSVWSPSAPLARTVDSIALGTSGSQLALVGSGSSSAVEALAPGSSSWKQLATERTLSSSAAARSCSIRALTGVAFGPAGEPWVSASCSRPGVIGLFALGGDHPSAVRIPTGSTLSGATVDVIAIEGGSSPSLLLGLDSPSGTSVVTDQEANGAWHTSDRLTVPAGQRLSGYGTVATSGWYAIVSTSSNVARISLAAKSSWTTLPPVEGAVAAVSGPKGTEAFVPEGKTLTVLRAGAGRWSAIQHLGVDIQYGSSS